MLEEMLRIAPGGVHYAFEPLPALFQVLQSEFGSNPHVSLHNLALSDSSGFVKFQHVVTNPGYSGLKQRRYDRENEVIEEIQVKTARLDDVLPDNIDIRFVKIDVEGAELQVLRGAVETFKRCKPVVVFEHGLGAADYYGTTPAQVFDLFTIEMGLRCFCLPDWLETDGRKSLDRNSFIDEFSSGRNYYFVASK